MLEESIKNQVLNQINEKISLTWKELAWNKEKCRISLEKLKSKYESEDSIYEDLKFWDFLKILLFYKKIINNFLLSLVESRKKISILFETDYYIEL